MDKARRDDRQLRLLALEVARGLSWTRLTVLSVHVAIVASLGYALMESGRGKAGGDRNKSTH